MVLMKIEEPVSFPSEISTSFIFIGIALPSIQSCVTETSLAASVFKLCGPNADKHAT